MKMLTSRKVLVLPIILIVSTLTIGLSFAYWADSLTITGVITTNHFDADLSLPQPWQDYAGDNEEVKDVGYIESVEIYDDPNDEEWDTSMDLIKIVIKNAYPGYEAWVHVGLHVVVGSMPGVVQKIIIDAPPELKVWVDPDWTGQQVHPCHEYFFDVHVRVIEVEGQIEPLPAHTYSFTVTVVMAQYNAPV